MTVSGQEDELHFSFIPILLIMVCTVTLFFTI